MEQAEAVPYGQHRKTPRDTAAAMAVGVSAACVAVAAPTTTAGPIDSGTAAYLDALKRKSIPLEDTTTLLVVADNVCTRRGDTSDSAQADRLMTAFPGR
ncbi:MAG: hypothetical protein ACRDUV_25475 [Pseudonocardiaceae bacterium]